jgi:hypothetical protein
MLTRIIAATAMIVSAPAFAAGLHSHGHGISGVVDGASTAGDLYRSCAARARCILEHRHAHEGLFVSGPRVTEMAGAAVTKPFLNCNVTYVDPPPADLWKKADEQSGR